MVLCTFDTIEKTFHLNFADIKRPKTKRAFKTGNRDCRQRHGENLHAATAYGKTKMATRLGFCLGTSNEFGGRRNFMEPIELGRRKNLTVC
jgi:hypothetical protein